MSLDKAGTLRYNLKYKRRLSAKSGRSSDRFYVEKKAAFLFRGSGYFFMYPKIPKTIVVINLNNSSVSEVDIQITSLFIEGGTTFFHRSHFDYSMCVILCQSTVFSDGFYFLL